MKKLFVLDACALIAFLNDEPGAEKVENLLRLSVSEDTQLVMHKINLLEVYYDTYRVKGKKIADEMLKSVKRLPIVVDDSFDDEIFFESARLKAVYKISLADSIALALSATRKASIVTADHHDFDKIEKKEKLSFEWIR
ncbi:MAG TPA: VapC toxin family PIN domain ribonuclease [Lentisphaeria bacterium]|nr:MAG: toxin PIN [Lentisphaerae bacterium GWF2_50_93]HCE46128.1 VapC toxin family PIN domain ribonuclease [Lentisphaeria bacterium]